MTFQGSVQSLRTRAVCSLRDRDPACFQGEGETVPASVLFFQSNSNQSPSKESGARELVAECGGDLA